MAAGMGTRFGQMTEDIPKGFIPFKGEPMIVRSIKTLIDCGIDRIVIGTGYKKEKYEELAAHYPQIECVFSPRYAETNSMTAADCTHSRCSAATMQTTCGPTWGRRPISFTGRRTEGSRSPTA